MTPRRIRCIVLAVTLFAAISAAGDDTLPPLEKRSRQLLSTIWGNPDPALPHHLARQLGPGQLVAAFYKGSRAERLAALDAAASPASLESPFTVLPSLAALMGAKDRRVAARAARALELLLSHETGQPTGFAEVVPGQIAQLRDQLVPLALDRRMAVDVRGMALKGVEMLERRIPEVEQTWMGELLTDSEVAIRRSAVTALRPPLAEALLKALAKIATNDTDPRMRGFAAAMICENALSHGVEEPSKDLVGLLKRILEDRQIPVDTLGGVLACVSHFKGDRRADLIDLILAHPDPAVSGYWKAEKQR